MVQLRLSYEILNRVPKVIITSVMMLTVECQWSSLTWRGHFKAPKEHIHFFKEIFYLHQLKIKVLWWPGKAGLGKKYVKAIEQVRGGQRVVVMPKSLRPTYDVRVLSIDWRAEQGKYDPVIGRDDKIRLFVQCYFSVVLRTTPSHYRWTVW